MANSEKIHINLVGGSSAVPSKPKKRKKKMSSSGRAKRGGRAVSVRDRGTSRNPR